MTSRERVIAAINLKQPDRTPMDFGGTMMSLCLPEFLQDMRDVLGYQLPDDRDLDGTWVDERIQKYLGSDLRCVHNTIPGVILKEIDHDEYLKRKKEKSFIKMKERDIITYLVRTEFPLAGMSFDDIRDSFNFPAPKSLPESHIDWYISTAKKYREDGFATSYWVSSGFFETLCWYRGYEQACIDLVDDEGIDKIFFDRLIENRLKEINQIVPALAPYIDIFCFGDDLAIQTGPFVSPETYRSRIMPYQKSVYSLMKELAPESCIFHHSCGSVYKLLPFLIEMGVSILNPTQISAVDMEPERLKALGNICYHGGIDLQEVLPHYKPDDVTKEVQRVKNILSPGGGYICAPCHSLPEDVPVENIIAMYRN